MKTIPALVIATLSSLASLVSAQAQTYVLESPIAVAASIMTQGSDTVTRSSARGTVTTKRLITTPFTNREVLGAMLSRGLITGSASDWILVYLEDEAGQGGAYARKKQPAILPTPVAVPADLLTLPVFGPSLSRGTHIASTHGMMTFQGATDVALATCTISGIPASGLANNGLRTLVATLQGVTYQLDTVTTTLAFEGGIDEDPSDRLIKGMIVVGSARLSPLPALP